MKNKNNLKTKQTGITLIALVVTIIVLLILAGISIAMLTGQNGILNRASEAKEKTGIAQEDENEKLQGYEDTINKFTSSNEDKLPVSPEGLKADTAIKNPDSYSEGTPSNAQATADGAGKYFAKPKSAKYVEGTVDTGVVVNINGSEFVWVPVDDVVVDKGRDSELPKTSSEATTKKYTPMAVQDGSNYKGILYEFSDSAGYLMYRDSTNNYQGESTDASREPAETNYDTGDYATEGITLNSLTTEYNAMIESVKKYKGFYVARYEAGLDNETNEIVFKNASNTNNKVTTTNAKNSTTYNWYGLYKKIKTFNANDDKVVSSMIWGSQYDAMMNWMAKTGNTVGTEDDDTKRNTTTITGGGDKPDVINNVYDLYGCHYEWTVESSDTNFRTYRGGLYCYGGSPANRFSDGSSCTNSYHSSRAALYIK